MKTIPDLYKAEPIPDSAYAEIKELLESGDLFRYTSTPSAVFQLEKEFAEFMGASYALAVSSCSSALFLSIKAMGFDEGSKIMIPAFTFAAVPSAVIHANCIPVLVNINDDFRVDIVDFEKKLDHVDGVLVSHMRGHTSDMDAILKLCKERDISVIEDAAHSLGTIWGDKKIGTLGKVGCFSFQSYKLVNAGEGGIMITDDPEIIAKAVIMSGAYEHNWKKHPVVSDSFEKWQNKLPVYNMRMNNISAAIIKPQISQITMRSESGLANHNFVAEMLNDSPYLDVPESLPKEVRAPDSIQFNLVGLDDSEAEKFRQEAKSKGVDIQIFGLSKDNARAFWNWNFIEQPNDLSQTRDILKRACDVRLPARLKENELVIIANIITNSANKAKY